MRPRSLSSRLILSSAAVSIVLLVGAGILLATLFQQALERNFDARLQAVLDGLLANVEVGTRTARRCCDSELADTRFSLPLSGWYWQVRPTDGKKLPIWPPPRCSSSGSIRMAGCWRADGADGVASFYLTDVNGTQLRAIEQSFKLGGNERNYSFLVAGNFDELKGEIDAFRRTLFVMPGPARTRTGGCRCCVQVHFGLRPLARLQAGVTAIREGRAEKLEGRIPRRDPAGGRRTQPADPVERRNRRARPHPGRQSRACAEDAAERADQRSRTCTRARLPPRWCEQTNVMRDQVSLYLDRARRAARAQGLAR